MSVWQLNLLGNPSLIGAGQALVLERRTLAVLAYLALEGPTPRSKLAGLLWPDSTEEKARNNLSQNQRRLRQATGEMLVVGGDVLQLSHELNVDAAQLKVYAFSGELERAVALSGEFLGSYDYDDLPEFADWRYGEREALSSLAQQALATLTERAERDGCYGEAVRYTEQFLELDPVAEGAYRSLMRLYYLAGDRPAALKAYRRCKEVLARELNVEPLPETKALARSIDQGEVQTHTLDRAERALPIEVLRPPVLVGREAAWAKMEAAWERGQFIILAGEAGVGKTRLALDFAASKGETLYLEGRPGDKVVPLSTSARSFRRILERRPGLELEPWVRRALSQLLPELVEEGDPPQNASGQHLLEALINILRTDLGISALVFDDLQFVDDPSIDAGLYIVSSSFPMGRPGGMPRWIACLRPNELSAHNYDVQRRLVDAGQTTWIDLEPLDAQTTTSLLNSLKLDALQDGVTPGIAENIYRRTGGNALFVLETLRNLLETDRLSTALPEQLPLTDKVDAIVRQRLARLSSGAQRAVQAAAVLQSDFDLELVGTVLNTEPMELIGVWEELERAQVFAGNRFSHDLLYEAALAGVSQPVKVLLNRRCAEVLASRSANPARVAKHHLAAGDRPKALPFLRAAAHEAAAARPADAERFFDETIVILETMGDRETLDTVREEKKRLCAISSSES